MKTYFQDNGSDEIIVLFNGWGMDERPYIPLLCKNYDFLFVHDYSDLAFKHNVNFKKYIKRYLVCFSAGVFMSSLVQDSLPEFSLKIAINGILDLFNKETGVCRVALEEMKNLSLENVIPFREKIIPNEIHREMFVSNQPNRDLESSLNELYAIISHYPKRTNKKWGFDKVLIGKQDITIPVENQIKSWENHESIHFLDGGHFPFYNFKSFNEIINFTPI